MSTKTLIATIAAVCGLLSAIVAATHDFVPDFAFRGSSLTGWHTLGHASWRAENGGITARPESAGGGGRVLGKECPGGEVLDGVPRRRERRCGRPAANGEDAHRRVEGRLRLAFGRRRFIRPDAERGRQRVDPDAPAESDRAVRANGSGRLDKR